MSVPRSRSVRRRILPLPRLSRRLAGPWKVAVLSAPAGYGKTTLASQYSRRRQALRRRIQPEDRDPAHLLGSFLAAGARVVPPVGTRTQRLFDSRRDMDRDGGLLTASFLDELIPSRGERLVILDDLHLLADARDALQWLRLVMEDSGPRVRYILTCRGTCPIPLARFNLLGGSVVLTADDLGFTEEEQRLLLQGTFHLRVSPSDHAALRGALGGWPAGLVLMARRLQETGRAPAIERLHQDETRTAQLFSFLAEEVYAPLTPTLQRALCKAAYLDELDPESVRIVLGEREGAYLLREAAQRDLFISSLPTGTSAPRFHPLFRDYLRGRAMEQLPGGERRDLLMRLARHWSQRGEMERAIHALLDAGNLERAVRLFDRSAARVTARRPQPSLASLALEILREPARASVAGQSPWILLYAGYQARDQGRFAEAIRLIRSAQDLWVDRRSRTILARAVRAEAQTAAVTGRFRESIDRIEYLLAGLPAQERVARGLMMLELGGLLLRVGRPEHSRRRVAQAERLLHGTPHELELADASMSLAEVNFTEGRWDIYLRHAQRALGVYRRAGYPARVRALLLNMSEACIYQGTEEHALTYVDEACTTWTGRPSGLFLCTAAIRRARAYSEMGRLDEAQDWLSEARSLAEHYGTPMSNLEIDVWEGTLNRRKGRLKHSVDLLSRAREGYSHIDSPSWLNLAGMERALVRGLMGHHDEALQDLSLAAQISRPLGDRKELARNMLFQARILQAAGRPFHAALQRALQLLVRERYLVLLRKESDVSTPLLSSTVRPGRTPLVERAVASLPDPLRARISGPSPKPVPMKIRERRTIRLRVRLLGDLEVFREDRKISFTRRAAEALIAYLALHPGGHVGRETLAEALWPGASADASRNRFDVTMNAARRALEPDAGTRGPFDILLSGPGWCRLSPACVTTDVSEFEKLARSCEPLLQALSRKRWSDRPPLSPAEARRALDTLRQALDAYHGDLLPELAYAEWTQHEREHLRDRHHRILLAFSAVALVLGRPDETADAARRVLADDPLQEEAHRLLMKALAARSDRAALVRAHTTFSRRLQRELATAPSPDTTALFHDLTARGAASRSGTSLPGAHDLPSRF